MKILHTILLFKLILVQLIIPQRNIEYEMHEIFTLVEGLPANVTFGEYTEFVSNLEFIMTSQSDVYDQEFNVTQEFDYAISQHQYRSGSLVPIPNSDNDFGIIHDITQGPWDYNTIGYGLYQFKVGFTYHAGFVTLYTFFLDYRDSDFPSEYNGNDIWVKYNFDNNTASIDWHTGTFIPISPNQIYNIWDHKSKSTRQGIQNIDEFLILIEPPTLSVSNSNGKPFLEWVQYQAWNGTKDYEVWRKLGGQPFVKIGEVQNIYNFLDNEIGIGHRPDLLVVYKVRVKTGTYISDFSNNESILYSYLLKENNTNSKDNLSDINYKLENYPNPFNPSTKISYSIPETDLVSLKVYDALGRQVAELVNEIKEAGIYEAEFDGSNLSSGIYYYTLTTNNYTQSRKMLLIK